MTNAEARFNKSHIRKVYAYSAVTCHLHFWQNDRSLLRATAVTRGWSGGRMFFLQGQPSVLTLISVSVPPPCYRYRNKSQHRRLALEKKKKKISRRSCVDSNPRPFDHESGALTTELSPLSNPKDATSESHIPVAASRQHQLCK